MAKKRSYKGKKQYAVYKAENRVYKNKVNKLERHLREYPEDETAKKNLARIQKDGYVGRSKPRDPGSNQTTPKIRLKTPFNGTTAGEQLSALLGIPMPKPIPKYLRKPKIKHKPRRK